MVSLRFPVRLSSAAFYADRKLFAYGFLFGLAPMAFLTHRKLFDRKLSIHYIFTDCE